MPSTRTKRVLAVSLSLTLATFGVVAMPVAASAAEIPVTSGADSGPGTLRAAIAAAAPTGDVITFDDTLTWITLDTSIVIDKSVELQGPGMEDLVITGFVPSTPLPEWVLFEVNGAGIDVVFSGVAIGNSGDDPLKAIDVVDANSLLLDGVRVLGFVSTEGAVSIDTMTGGLTIRNSELLFNENTASSGGAINVSGSTSTVTILDSLFDQNEANGDGGALALADTTGNIQILGTTLTNNAGDFGAGAWVGDVGGDVLIEGSHFELNSSNVGGGIYFGGNIPTTSIVEIDNVTFDHNSGEGGGGAYFAENMSASVLVTGSTFTNNQTLDGAGLAFYLSTDTVTIENSTFSNNEAWFGAGIRGTWNDEMNPVITITSSTFTGNVIESGQTGVSISVGLSAGSLTVVNSTFDEPGGYGTTPHALSVNVRDEGSPAISVHNSTISAQGGVFFDSEEDHSTATLLVSHSILNTQGAPAVTLSDSPGAAEVEWSLLSGGLDAAVVAGVGNQLNVASMGLGTLQDNGGPTWTMLPAATSPAVNAGDPSFAGLTLDQRGTGFDRVVDVIDIGAVEVQAGSTGGGALADTGAGEVIGYAVGGAGILLLGLLLWILGQRRVVS